MTCYVSTARARSAIRRSRPSARFVRSQTLRGTAAACARAVYRAANKIDSTIRRIGHLPGRPTNDGGGKNGSSSAHSVSVKSFGKAKSCSRMKGAGGIGPHR